MNDKILETILEIPKKDGKIIRGKLFFPEKREEKFPLLIFCHGFGSCYAQLEHHGPSLAEKGFLCFFPDFCGGSLESTSDGSMLEMSVLTEVEDLLTVIEALKQRADVDSDRLFLLGESQGGFVTALTAAKIPHQIRALCLWYPAFVIPDDARRRCLTGIAKEETVLGQRIGACYNEAVLDMDPYEEIKAYPGPVLMIHGDQDKLVPISYSERALEVYLNASLSEIPNAGHGFDGGDSIRANRETADFFLRNL